eukprot:2172249-Amphidinium_carterae.2
MASQLRAQASQDFGDGEPSEKKSSGVRTLITKLNCDQHCGVQLALIASVSSRAVVDTLEAVVMLDSAGVSSQPAVGNYLSIAGQTEIHSVHGSQWGSSQGGCAASLKVRRPCT